MRTVSKKMKLILLLMVMMFAVMPVQAAAPAKVIKAAEKCVNENNRCIVVDNTAGRVYLLKKCKGKWTVKKDFRCTVGDRINPKKHYHLLRNGDTDKAFYYEGGKKFAHTIDPKTGRPVQHSLLSATVLTDDCALADAYATSFMVMGLERAQKLLERHPELMAYFIYSDGNGENAVWFSPSLKDKIAE